MFFDDLREINSLFYEFLEEDCIEAKLQEGTFIISNFESAFEYIVCDGLSEDSPVYSVDLKTEDCVRYETISNSFIDYLTLLASSSDNQPLSTSFTVDENGIIDL